MNTGDPYFRIYHPQPSPLVRLVCFPHAGGSASFYRGWTTLLPRGVELAIAMYPGRENRLADPHPDTLETLAGEFAARVPQDVPAVLFGHSMGGTVAFEVVRRMVRSPERLVVSGQPAPHRHRPGDVHLRGEEGLVEELRAVGGTDASLLDHPEIRDLVLPVVRADYRLIERYRPGPVDPLAVPIAALIGSDDPEVNEDEARAWADWTVSGFQLHTIAGGHFGLVEEPASFMQWLIGLLPAGGWAR